jgi:DNA-binding Lrp family transcriptional regulator
VAFSAYVLVQTEVGKASAVARSIAEIAGVVSSEAVTGRYDVIVRADAASVDDLGKLVIHQIQLVDGITRTETCPVVRA